MDELNSDKFSWFSKDEARQAYGGEPQFYEFHAAYGNLKYSDHIY
jgi:hypothetical protein